jgi:hypothetical protein
VLTWWPRLRQRKHRPRAHRLKARLRSSASTLEELGGMARTERRPEPTSCQPSSSPRPAAGAWGAWGGAEESSGNCDEGLSVGSRGLREQQRSSLSAEENTVGLKGDGGREPGTGGGWRRGAGGSPAMVAGATKLEEDVVAAFTGSWRRRGRATAAGSASRETTTAAASATAEAVGRTGRTPGRRGGAGRREGASGRPPRGSEKPEGGERSNSGDQRPGEEEHAHRGSRDSGAGDRKGRKEDLEDSGSGPGGSSSCRRREISAAAPRTHPSPPWSPLCSGTIRFRDDPGFQSLLLKKKEPVPYSTTRVPFVHHRAPYRLSSHTSWAS